MFRSVLTGKAERANRLVVAVHPAYTSQRCSGCGEIQKKSLSVRTHRCSVCGLVLDRDTNAAVNIRAAVGQHSLAALAAVEAPHFSAGEIVTLHPSGDAPKAFPVSSASVSAAVRSMPLSVRASMRARMISARLMATPLVARMSAARRSRKNDLAVQ